MAETLLNLSSTECHIHEDRQQEVANKNPFENLQFTCDFYRCGCCSREYDLFEDLILHKINSEGCSLVLFASHKLNGVQIPRFIQGVVNVEESAPVASEETAPICNTSVFQKEFTHVMPESIQKAEESCDISLNFLNTSLSKSKERSVCKICGNSYRDATILKTHIATVHSNEKPFSCDFQQCSFACKTKASLERHVRRHTGERPFICESCGRSFRESGTLARHIKSIVPCTKKSDDSLPRYGKTNLTSELKSIEQSGETVQIVITKECEIPDRDDELDDADAQSDDSLDSLKKDASQSLMKLLESSYTKEPKPPNFKDSIPKENTESETVILSQQKIQEAVEEQIKSDDLFCLACHQKTNGTDELSQHLQQHLDEFKFRCDKCFYVDKSKEGINNHTKTMHTKKTQDDDALFGESWQQIVSTQLIHMHNILDEKIGQEKRGNFYRCHVCLKKFSYKSYFRLHMNSHTGSTSYECDICKRTFINKDSLQKHLISHSSKRSFECHICARQFKRSSHLKDHLRTHDDLKPYVCKTCNRSFKWQCVLKVHETTHSRDCLFCCETCGKQLRNKSSLIRHSKRHKTTGQKGSTRSESAVIDILPSLSSKSIINEANTAAANIENAEQQPVENQQTYLLVLDENALVLGDATCILENGMIQSEDMLE